ncbi:hypothetical protein OA855_03405 [Pelagibacteraceae bacterium]|nr:hypothetical protein [Pelagibacteraceae bacterium]
MSYNFIFFYIDTNKEELSNQHAKIERESIVYFIKSIKKYHPESKVIHCTDLLTKSFEQVDIIHRTEFDRNYLMLGKIKSFSTFKIEKTSVYLDPDMLLMKIMPIDKFKEKADVFLLKRSFNNNVVVPKIFRGLEFLKHKDKSYADLYPFVACLVICNNADFWIKCLSYFNQIEPIYKIWFGDQEILRKMVNNNDFKFGFIEERDFGCPPQNLSGKTRPFLIHFKGKINKDIIKKYYQYV